MGSIAGAPFGAPDDDGMKSVAAGMSPEVDAKGITMTG
jgi:hypothetical protein